ncbi:MAG: hypothetical protein HS104_39945 [Polyangiaceae bacterium]|nr:hypothetical protein [Polyangiaceae bacterium]MCE7888354.1 hypothetical protein [Sorangiineae bacterium PRO1]MCL4749493.1 hypothetical protein [Myxococcales bacterium]
MSERPRVELLGADSASGLADLLFQFLEQTLDASVEKAAEARALRGDLVVRAAEDEGIAVRIAFLGDRIELSDLGAAIADDAPSIQGDFLSVAHVTSGQASPLALLLRRQLRVRFDLAQLPFLWRVLGFMRIEDRAPARQRLVVLALTFLLILALVLFFWLRTPG